MTFVVFLHMSGIGLWLGGAAIAVLINTLETSEGPTARRAVDVMLAKGYAWVVAPGAMLAVGSGVALTMMVASSGSRGRLGDPPVAAMQAVGLLAGLVEIFVAFPASQRLGQVTAATDAAEVHPAAARFRGRMRVASSVSLLLVLVAMFFGVIG